MKRNSYYRLLNFTFRFFLFKSLYLAKVLPLNVRKFIPYCFQYFNVFGNITYKPIRLLLYINVFPQITDVKRDNSLQKTHVIIEQRAGDFGRWILWPES